MNYLTKTTNSYINYFINKIGYNNLTISMLIISIIFASLYLIYPLKIINLLNIIIFSIGFYLLIKANIQHYFFFFIYALLQSYINIKDIVYILDFNSIIILIVFTIILLLLLLHGICRWQRNNKIQPSFIIPNSLKSKKYVVFFCFYLAISIILTIVIKNLYAGLAIFAITSILSAIYLINEKKIQGWFFLFFYFLSIAILSNHIVSIVILIIYSLLCIIGYKYWSLLLKSN